jgi:hypothetical protein
VITWNSRTLYEKPVTGVCAVKGAYETGRFYLRDGVKPVFVGNTAAPTAVDDYIGFLTAMGTVQSFKASSSRADAISERVGKPKKKK